MRKIVALFTVLAFVMTLGIAFAQENTAPAAAPDKQEKAPVKKKKKRTSKKKKKKAETQMEEAAPAPATEAK